MVKETASSGLVTAVYPYESRTAKPSKRQTMNLKRNWDMNGIMAYIKLNSGQAGDLWPPLQPNISVKISPQTLLVCSLLG